ncbi:uncharacterized protein LAJ45_02083 [Morchella importuna]|uniref:uncharacterized protein n=1 Tax=Morchella importuna TaxID=1174673 RepID=UPI001E8D41A3|nr:uncharacterized protein LAJ45_02083 [Morchella importuna]KAH8154315.1 hypothetical protein LAJ45_02083 [Morchella importuna]
MWLLLEYDFNLTDIQLIQLTIEDATTKKSFQPISAFRRTGSAEAAPRRGYVPTYSTLLYHPPMLPSFPSSEFQGPGWSN